MSTWPPVSRLPRCRGCRPAATRHRVSRRGHRLWAHWNASALVGESTPDVELFQHYGLTSAPHRHHGGGVAGGGRTPAIVS
ncbi:MAG: phage baseplate assembly protein domain-containing protein [Sodalis sp. (in: enterobacteria)]|uniref:phage baseplate assembly protein domain-containing protein n=1 Tax=Sodalis sp. (in: enterobacteria) TaxID=1898979 RepID=UPI003F349841